MESSIPIESSTQQIPQQSSDVPKPKEVRLCDVPVVDQQGAFNLLINFVTLAQKRGAFTIEESAKLWECIRFFTGAAPSPPPAEQS